MAVHAIMSLPRLRVLGKGQRKAAAGFLERSPGLGRGRPGPPRLSLGPQQEAAASRANGLWSCSLRRKGGTKAMKEREGEGESEREGGGRREAGIGREEKSSDQAEDDLAQLPGASGFQETEPPSQPAGSSSAEVEGLGSEPSPPETLGTDFPFLSPSFPVWKREQSSLRKLCGLFGVKGLSYGR